MRPTCLVVCVLILVMPIVQATDGVDTYPTEYNSGVGSVKQTWTIGYPSERPNGDRALVAVSLASNPAAAAGYVLAVEATDLYGCFIVGTPTTTSSANGATMSIILNLTAEDCHGRIRMTATTGSNQVRINARISILAPSVDDPKWLNNVSQFAYFLAVIYVVTTRFIRGPFASILRIIFDIVGFGLLQLPDLPAQQYARIAGALYAVLTIDAFQLLRSGDA